MKSTRPVRLATAPQTGRHGFRLTLKDLSDLSSAALTRPDGLPSAAPEGSTPARLPDADRDGLGRSTAPALADPRLESPPARATTPAARVLIADDHPAVRESLAKLLRTHGYEVEVAADGREALAKFDPQRTDLVLLDLDMPLTHGWDAFEQLIASKADQAVILITGMPEPCRWAAVGPPGVVVEKPIDATVLLDSIRQTFGETAARRRERLHLQRTLARQTRPLPLPARWHCYERGGLNE